MAYQEYDPNEFLSGLSTPVQPKQATGYQEYDPNDFLSNLDTVKKDTNWWTKPAQVLKGAEVLAKPWVARADSEGIKDLGKGIASLADNAYGVIPATASYITQPFARLFTSPQRAKEIADEVGSVIDKPIGKAFGITQDPAYQNEATSRAMQYAGQKMGEVADIAAQKTGLPKEDIEHMIASGTFLATHGAGSIAKPIVRNAAEQLSNKFNEYKDVAVNGPKPPPAPVRGFADAVEQPVRQASVQVEPAPEQFNNVGVTRIEAQPVNRAETAPFKPQEIESRKELLRKIGLEDHRQSALEGNPKEAASQFITSQADQGPYATGITEQINNEKAALENHFGKIANDAGGISVRYNDPCAYLLTQV